MRWAVNVTAILVIIYLVVPLIVEVEANPVPISWLRINSPVSSTIYNSTTVSLEAVQGNQEITNPVINMTYSLDHAPYKEITNLTKSEEYHFINYPVADFIGTVALDSLAQGNHTITVYTYCKYHGAGSATTVEFEVGRNEPDTNTEFSQTTAIVIVTLLVGIGSVLAVITYRKRKISK